MLHSAEENYSALIESTEDMIWSVDLDFGLIAFNRALAQNCYRNFGVHPKPGMRPEELLSPERAALWPPLYRRALAEGPFRCEHTLGDGRTLELSLTPIQTDGRVTGISVFGKNISQTKAAEVALIEAAEKYRNIFEGAQEGIYQTTPEGRYLAVNPAFARIVGYESPQAMMAEEGNLAVSLWAHPEERAEFLRQLDEKGGAVEGFETQCKRKNGSLIWVRVSCRKVIAPDGKIAYLEGFVKDISEARQAQQQLVESETRFRSFFYENGSMMLLVDGDGTIVAVNNAATAFYGYTTEQLVGRSIGKLNGLSDETVAVDSRSAITHERRSFTRPHRLASGEVRDVEVYCSRIHVGGRDLICSIVHDVTERKRAQDALAESREQLRLFVEHAPAAIAMFDDQMNYLQTTRRWLEHEGLGEEDVRGRSHYEVIPDLPEKWKQNHRRALAGEALSESADLVTRKDGKQTWNQWELRPWHRADGSVGGVFIFCEDVTERKLATEAIQEREESLREAQTIAGLGSYVGDLRTGIWTISPLLHQLLGLPDDYAGTVEAWAEVIRTEDRAMMTAYFAEEVLGKRQDFDKEYRIVRPSDGVERWVHGMGRLEYDAEGNPIRLRGVIRDITERKLAEIKLRESEERYRESFDQAAMGIVHAKPDGRILRANKRFADIVGYPLEEIQGMTFQEITRPDDISASEYNTREIWENPKNNAVLEKCYVRKNGTQTWVKLTVSAQLDSEGRPLHLMAIVEDINARKAAEERLAAAIEELRVGEERYRTIFQTSIDVVLITRQDNGTIIDINQAALNILGYDRSQILGKTTVEIGIWANTGDRAVFAKMMRESGACRNMEVQARKRNGEIFWSMLSASTIELDGVPCILSIIRDISAAKAAEEEIRSLAFYDPLTQLPNRRLMSERLRQMLASDTRSGRKGALLFIDIDDFKTLNDTLGHKTGDLLLQEAAFRLGGCLREVDTVARLGGDEFVVILEDLSGNAEEAGAQATVVAEKIRTALARPYVLSGRECVSSSSIGITLVGDTDAGIDELLQQADIAMYQAKAAGRNTVRFFAPALQAAVYARVAMEEELRIAIRENQFLLLYQPQVESGKIIGTEALVRWRHPQRGMVPPNDFIPIAEQSGLIVPIGAWVLEAACKQIALWAKRPHTEQINIAVNISAMEFRQSGFVKQVLSTLRNTGANPHRLKLELTESMLLENVEEVIATMTLLKSYGVSFSLDDFGTGYSSLSYLKRLPLEQLKIDRAFVRDMLRDETSGAIAQTIIALSKAMNMSVIAEGVETEAERVFLADLGCHCYQGYLFAPPLALEKFEQRITTVAAA